MLVTDHLITFLSALLKPGHIYVFKDSTTISFFNSTIVNSEGVSFLFTGNMKADEDYRPYSGGQGIMCYEFITSEKNVSNPFVYFPPWVATMLIRFEDLEKEPQEIIIVEKL